MRLGNKDHKVIEAFCAHQYAQGHKLSTDGYSLYGHWMGGSHIAEWHDGSITFHDLGSKAAQTVQRAVRKCAKKIHQNPTFWIQDALKHHKKGSLHRAAHVPMGKNIPASTLERLTHSRSSKTRKRAVLARTLRGFHKGGR